MIKFKDFISELHKPKELGIFRKIVSDSDISNIYHVESTLDELFKNFGFKILGAGAFGVVYGKPGYPYVIKIFMKDEGYMLYLKWVLKNQRNKYVPKIRGKYTKINKSFSAVRMEKLQDYNWSKQSDAFRSILRNPEEIFKDTFDNIYGTWYRSDDKNLVDLCRFLLNKNNIDIHTENIMARGNDFVLIDPLSGPYLKTVKIKLNPKEIENIERFVK